jgi:hypothetical protein
LPARLASILRVFLEKSSLINTNYRIRVKSFSITSLVWH